MYTFNIWISCATWHCTSRNTGARCFHSSPRMHDNTAARTPTRSWTIRLFGGCPGNRWGNDGICGKIIGKYGENHRKNMGNGNHMGNLVPPKMCRTNGTFASNSWKCRCSSGNCDFKRGNMGIGPWGFATPLVEKRKHAGFNKPRVGGFTSKKLRCHRHHRCAAGFSIAIFDHRRVSLNTSCGALHNQSNTISQCPIFLGPCNDGGPEGCLIFRKFHVEVDMAWQSSGGSSMNWCKWCIWMSLWRSFLSFHCQLHWSNVEILSSGHELGSIDHGEWQGTMVLNFVESGKTCQTC
jgi:hypothetical protein